MKQLLSPSREYRIRCHAFPYVLAYCGPDRSWVVTKLTISQTHPATDATVTRTLRSLAPLFLTAKAFTATRRTRTLVCRRIHARTRFPLFCRAVGELLHRTLLLAFVESRREKCPQPALVSTFTETIRSVSSCRSHQRHCRSIRKTSTS